MEKEQYKLLFKLEDTYWWHVGLRNLIKRTLLSNSSNKTNFRILDAGCGTGGNLRVLNEFGYTVGIDLSEDAINFAKLKSKKGLINGSVSILPFKDECFDYILSVDVLYHKNVINDAVALKEFIRVLKKSGVMILHLPAFEFLKGPHDKFVHTQRRYTKKEIKRKLLVAGFKLKKITYRSFVFFLLAFFIRIFNRNNKIKEFKPLPVTLNAFFIRLLNLENSILKIIDIPLGLSVFSIATKE